MQLYHIVAALCLCATASCTVLQVMDQAIQLQCYEEKGAEVVLKYQQLKNNSVECVAKTVDRIKRNEFITQRWGMDPVVIVYDAICRYKADLLSCSKDVLKGKEICIDGYGEEDRELTEKELKETVKYMCSSEGRNLFVQASYEFRRKPWAFAFCFRFKMPQAVISCSELENSVVAEDKCRFEEEYTNCLKASLRSCNLPNAVKFIESVNDAASKVDPCVTHGRKRRGIAPRTSEAEPRTHWNIGVAAIKVVADYVHQISSK